MWELDVLASEEGEPPDTYAPYTSFLSVTDGAPELVTRAGLSVLAYPLPVPSPLHSGP